MQHASTLPAFWPHFVCLLCLMMSSVQVLGTLRGVPGNSWPAAARVWSLLCIQCYKYFLFTPLYVFAQLLVFIGLSESPLLCPGPRLSQPRGGRPPPAGTETHFNQQALNFDRAPPSPPLSAVPSIPRLLGFAGVLLHSPSPGVN